MRRTEVIVESAIILYLSLASIFEVLSCAFSTHNYGLSLNGNAVVGARGVCINVCKISFGMRFSDFWDPEAKRPCGEVETRDTPAGRKEIVVVESSTIKILTPSNC